MKSCLFVLSCWQDVCGKEEFMDALMEQILKNYDGYLVYLKKQEANPGIDYFIETITDKRKGFLENLERAEKGADFSLENAINSYTTLSSYYFKEFFSILKGEKEEESDEERWNGYRQSSLVPEMDYESNKDWIVSIVGPSFKPFMEHYLEVCPNFSYSTGWDRKPFRSENRQLYVDIIWELLGEYIGLLLTSPKGMDALNQEIPLEELLIDEAVPTITNRKRWLAVYFMDQKNEKVIHMAKEMILSENNANMVTYNLIYSIFHSQSRELVDLVKKLLVAAGRQEGLRQVILENADGGYPAYFIEILYILRDEKMLRFSATIRALMTWINIQDLDITRKKYLEEILDTIILYLTQPDARKEALEEKNLMELYLALWAGSFYEIENLQTDLDIVLKKPEEHRLMAVLMFVNISSDFDAKMETIEKILALSESDKVVATCFSVAPLAILSTYVSDVIENANERKNRKTHPIYQKNFTQEQAKFFFDKGLVFYQNMSKSNMDYGQMGIGGGTVRISRYEVQGILILAALTLQDDERLNEIGHLKTQTDAIYAYVVEYLNSIETPEQRDILVSMLSSKYDTVFVQAAYYVEQLGIELTEKEIIKVEQNLRLKAESTRVNTLNFLKKQTPPQLLKTIERLLESKKLEIRLAGLDLVLNTVQKEEAFASIEAPALKLVQEKTYKDPAELVLVRQINGEKEVEEIGVKNGFGLYDDCLKSQLKPLEKPKTFDGKEQLFSLSVEEFKEEYGRLAQFILDHKDAEAENNTEYGDRTFILGNYPNLVPYYYYDEEREILFKDLWDGYLAEHPLSYQFYFEVRFLNAVKFYQGEDPSGEEVVLEDDLDILEFIPNDAKEIESSLNELLPDKKIREAFFPVEELEEKQAYIVNVSKDQGRLDSMILSLLEYYLEDKVDLALSQGAGDGLVAIYFEIPKNLFAEEEKTYWGNIEKRCPLLRNPVFGQLSLEYKKSYFQQDEADDIRKFLEIGQAYQDCCKPASWYEPAYCAPEFLEANQVAFGHEKGVLNQNELIRFALEHSDSDLIQNATTKKKTTLKGYYFNGNREYYEDIYPKTVEKISELVHKLVEVESLRGDTETEASPYISSISSFEGIRYFADLITRLNAKDTLQNGYLYSKDTGKKGTISHLIAVNQPAKGDSKETFTEALEGRKVPRSVLMDVAVYSPQWIEILSAYMEAPGLEDLIYYFIAHTGDFDVQKYEEKIAFYSPIKIDQFEEGTFDVHWFNRAYKGVSQEDYELAYKAARYISSSNSHRRARLYADAAQKKVSLAEMEERIKDKRNQDYVRAYGVVPIKKNRDKDLVHRYKFLQNFLKEGQKFGAQRKASEASAVSISLDNLSQNAGFPNPTAMSLYLESIVSKDQADILQDKEIDGYKVEVDTSELGNYKLRFYNEKGKAIKSVPAKLKKNAQFEEMQKAVKESKELYRRSVRSFESFMEMQESLSVKDMSVIFESPLFYSFLSSIVFLSDGHLGYLKDGSLVSPNGDVYELKDDDFLQVAHPYHFYTQKVWSLYQKDLFDRQVAQPFKQIFREFYPPNADELADGISRRYAGYALQRNKLFALMKERNWIGGGRKFFYGQKIMVDLFQIADYFSPNDIEEPTLEIIEFVEQDTGKRVEIKDVPSVLFSEVMRDVDLFVSVAFVGGVDPEVSLSTIEMRSAILGEMIRLLGLKNVKIKGNFAHINGVYGEYTVHLGSGTVQKMGRGSIHILAVSDARRGRLFLPFMDQDPKTAEIISKIVLLSEDGKIKDPTILEQITE